MSMLYWTNLLKETGVAEGGQCTGGSSAQARQHSVLQGWEYWFFGREREVEELKQFSLLLPSCLLRNVKSESTEVTNQGRAGQILNFAVSVYRMFPQIKKSEGNYGEKKHKRSCLPAPVLVPRVACFPARLEWQAPPESMTS